MNKYTMLCLFPIKRIACFFLCTIMLCAMLGPLMAPHALAGPFSFAKAVQQKDQKQEEPFRLSLEFVSSQTDVSQAETAPIKLIIWLDVEQGYHAYAHEPLITTRPTTVTLLRDGNAVDVPISYPDGLLIQDIFEPKDVMVYEGRTPITMTIPRDVLESTASPATSLTVKVSGLLCSNTSCWPFDEVLALTELPYIGGDGALDGATFDSESTPKSINTVVQVVENKNEIRETSAQNIQTWHVTPRYASPSLEVTGLGKALFFGLLAGLILNLMPCVLPVLGFKLSAFIAASASHGGEDSKQAGGQAAHKAAQAERVRAFREHNIFFALGILAWFLILAMVLSWAGLAWGQLFQQTPILMGLMLVVFLLALSMFGVFTLPVLDIKASSSSHGSPRMQAFMTGAVATLLATPCSGPLLGGVLGWAFGQSSLILAMVFVAVGLGMALPYIALSIWPKLVHKVPRAGAWTGLVEQAVGFFLMATALYLWTILPQDMMMPSLFTLFVAALCAWIWGHWSGPAASTVQRILVRLCTTAIVACMVVWTLTPKEPEPPLWQAFDAVAVQELLGEEPLVLEFTADWCPNCKVLERTTLTHDNVQAWAKDYGARFIRVDLTRQENANDAAAEALLHALGSHSIPLVALFPKGADFAKPLVLRDIFTPSQMDEALKEAFGD